MAIKVNGINIISNDRSLKVSNGSVGFGSIGIRDLLDLTGMEVGDTIYVDEYEMLATWNGTNWITTEGGVVSLVGEGFGGNYETVPGNGYKYHTFINNGTFIVTSSGAVDVLVVGGGGGTGPWGDSRNGGAGGGGVAYWPNVDLPTGSYSIIVGGRSGESNGPGGRGKDSIFADGNSSFSVIAKGGGGSGGGPRPSQQPASDGGSGGGGSGFSSNTPSGDGIQPVQNPGRVGLLQYGNDGGINNYNGSEGGGGAGEIGYPSSPNDPKRGRGGDGIQIPNFDIYHDLSIQGAVAGMGSYFGGGGNGNGASQGSARPLGGGGQSSSNGPGQPGVDYTGGGGGGGGAEYSGGGCYGGRGLVVIRYSV